MRGGGGNTKASRKVKVTITFPDYISNEDRVVLQEVIQGLVTNDTELKGNLIQVRPCGYTSVTFLLNTTKDEQRIAEVFETLIFEGKGICDNQIWNTTLQVTEAADAVESVAEELQEQNEATEREKEELQNALQEHEFRMQELADNSAMLAEESAAKDAQLAATRVALDAKEKAMEEAMAKITGGVAENDRKIAEAQEKMDRERRAAAVELEKLQKQAEEIRQKEVETATARDDSRDQYETWEHALRRLTCWVRAHGTLVSDGHGQPVNGHFIAQITRSGDLGWNDVRRLYDWRRTLTEDMITLMKNIMHLDSGNGGETLEPGILPFKFDPSISGGIADNIIYQGTGNRDKGYTTQAWRMIHGKGATYNDIKFNFNDPKGVFKALDLGGDHDHKATGIYLFGTDCLQVGDNFPRELFKIKKYRRPDKGEYVWIKPHKGWCGLSNILEFLGKDPCAVFTTSCKNVHDPEEAALAKQHSKMGRKGEIKERPRTEIYHQFLNNTTYASMGNPT